MAMDPTSFQVVFMIDVNGIIQSSVSEQSVQKQANEIGLCAAKILLDYQDRFNAHKGSTTSKNQAQEHAKFEFGYKFYNSLSQTIVRPSFKELSVKNFDSFYEDIELRLDDEKLKANGSNLKKPEKIGCDVLSMGLKEMVHDFTWEKNDNSPVRMKGKSKAKMLPSRGHQNVVYLFSPCPHTTSELKDFIYEEDSKSVKKTPKKGKDIAKTMIGQTLHQAMISIAGIQLFWIDVDWLSELLYEGQEYPGKGFYLLNDALKTVGGCVIPIQGILHSKTDMMNAALPVNDVIHCHEEIQQPGQNTKAVIRFPKNGNSYQVLILPLLKHDHLPVTPPSQINVIGSIESWDLELLDSSMGYALHIDEMSVLCQTFLELSKEGKKFVVSLDDGAHGLLQPMTKTSATITGIQGKHVLDFHRQLLPTQTQEEIDKSKLKEFIGKHLRAHGGHEKIEESYMKHMIEVEETKETDEKGKHFDTCMIKRWYARPQELQASSMLATLKKSTIANNPALKEEQIFIRKLGRRFAMQKVPSKDSINSSVPSPADSSIGGIGKRRSMDEKETKTLTRSQMIVERSRRLHAAKRTSSQGVSVETLAGKVGTKSTIYFTPPPSDFKTDSDLAQYLKDQYEKVAASDEAFHQFSQMALSVVSFFYKSQDSVDPRQETLGLLKKHILIDDVTLKKKHGSKSGNHEAKIREVQLQTFLHLEAEAVLADHDAELNIKLVEMLARMLRTLSLAGSDTAILSRFLNKEIMDAYSHQLPKTLAELYEELMLPMPEAMPSLFSPTLTATPAFSDDESRSSNQPSIGSASIMSTELFSEESNPFSNRPRRSRFMSKDLGQNTKRTIALPQRKDPKALNPEMKLSRSMSSSGLSLQKEDPVKASKQKAVRNLTGAFVTGQSSSAKPLTRTLSRIDRGQGDASTSRSMASSRLIGRGMKQERRQSIAVMEKIGKTPPPKKILKTTTVQDTPTRKRQLRSIQAAADDEVVLESPRKSPTLVEKGKRKHSFYDPSKKSRNVQKYQEQEVQPIKFRSPARGLATTSNSGFLFSQLSSPVLSRSPMVLRRTPKRFNPGSAVKQSPRTPRALDLLMKSPRSSGRQVKRRLLGAEEETSSPRKRICVEDSPVMNRRTPIKVTESPMVSRLRDTPRSILKSPLARGTPGKLLTPLRSSAMRAVKFDDTPSKKTISPNKSPRMFKLKTSPNRKSPSKSPAVSPNTGKKSPPKKLSLINPPSQKFSGMSQSPEMKYNLRKSPESSKNTPEKRKNASPATISTSPGQKKSPRSQSPKSQAKSLGLRSKSPAKSPRKSPEVKTSKSLEIHDLRSRHDTRDEEKSPQKTETESTTSTSAIRSIFKTISFDFGNSPPKKDFDLGDIIDRLEPTPSKSFTTPQKPSEQVAAMMSPNSRPIIRTPESFDKWKRVKRHGPNSLSKSPLLDSSQKTMTSSQSSRSENKSPIVKVKRMVGKDSWLSPSRHQMVTLTERGTPESTDSIVLLSPLKPEYKHLIEEQKRRSRSAEKKTPEFIVEYQGVTCAQAGLEVISPLTSRDLSKTNVETKLGSFLREQAVKVVTTTPTDPQKKMDRMTRSRSSEKKVEESVIVAPEASKVRRSLCSLENTTPIQEATAKKPKTKVSSEKRKVKFSAEKVKSGSDKVKSSAEKGLKTSSEKARVKRLSLERSSVEKRLTRRSFSPLVAHNQNVNPGKTNSGSKKTKKSLFERPFGEKSPTFQNTISKETTDAEGSTPGNEGTTFSPALASNKSSPAMSLAAVDELDGFDWSYWTNIYKPMRYTRGLSKECGLAPDAYRQIATKSSPIKNPTSAKIDMEITGRGSKRSLVSSPEASSSETPKRRRLDDSVPDSEHDDVFENVPFSPAVRKLQNDSPNSGSISKKSYSPVSTKAMLTLICSPILSSKKHTPESEQSERRSRRVLYK